MTDNPEREMEEIQADDLIARLRHAAKIAWEEDSLDFDPGLAEAADTIERLRLSLSASEKRAEEAEDRKAYETGWVIEYGESEPSRPLYWIGPSENPAHWPFGMWSTDNLKAVRFSRREDAEAVVKLTKLHAHDDVRAFFRIADHGWG